MRKNARPEIEVKLKRLKGPKSCLPMESPPSGTGGQGRGDSTRLGLFGIQIQARQHDVIRSCPVKSIRRASLILELFEGRRPIQKGPKRFARPNLLSELGVLRGVGTHHAFLKGSIITLDDHDHGHKNHKANDFDVPVVGILFTDQLVDP